MAYPAAFPHPHHHHHHHPLGPHDPAAVDFRAFYPYTPNEVKHRKRTTTAQLKVLEAIFKKDTKPNAALRQELALQLDMTPRGVQVWFQNRRAKEKVKGGKPSGAKGAGSSLGEGPKEEEFRGTLAVKGEADDADDTAGQDDEGDELDAYSRSPTISQSPSSANPSPPQLHLITDATKFSWQDSPVEPPPDSATFPIRPPANPFRAAAADLYHRRGSLPATAFPQPDTLASPLIESFDPLLRRGSVDASLQRLATNPFAGLARAKNTALYGPGFGVAHHGSGSGTALRHHQMNRLPYGYPPTNHQRRSLAPGFAPMPQYGPTRRLSMDSRQTRLAAMAPAPLTPYDAVIRASLPDHLYTVSQRTVASPIPGPLPSPGFSFGAASTPSMASPSSGDSERNSPDSLRSFAFRSEEHDEDATSPTYDAYSRFGSIASIATSESSINSAYYAEIGGPVGDHGAAEERRDSCSSGHFLGLLSELEVSQQPELQASMGLASYPPHDDYGFAAVGKDLAVSAELGHHQQQQQQQGQQQQQHVEASYPSPASTISPRDAQSPRAQDAAPSSMPISTSSELAFALEGKPDQALNHQEQQQQYLSYGPSEQAEQDGSASFYATQQAAQEPRVQQQQQESTYSSSYSSLSEAYPNEALQQQQRQQAQQMGFLAVYNATGAYADPMASSAVVGMDNGMQSVDAFAAYT